MASARLGVRGAVWWVEPARVRRLPAEDEGGGVAGPRVGGLAGVELGLVQGSAKASYRVCACVVVV